MDVLPPGDLGDTLVEDKLRLLGLDSGMSVVAGAGTVKQKNPKDFFLEFFKNFTGFLILKKLPYTRL